MAEIGTGWVDGAWVEAAWVHEAWSDVIVTILDLCGPLNSGLVDPARLSGFVDPLRKSDLVDPARLSGLECS